MTCVPDESLEAKAGLCLYFCLCVRPGGLSLAGRADGGFTHYRMSRAVAEPQALITHMGDVLSACTRTHTEGTKGCVNNGRLG